VCNLKRLDSLSLTGGGQSSINGDQSMVCSETDLEIEQNPGYRAYLKNLEVQSDWRRNLS
jgi:hypothetical protein